MNTVTPNVVRTLKAEAGKRMDTKGASSEDNAIYAGMWAAFEVILHLAEDKQDYVKPWILTYMDTETWDTVQGFVDMAKEAQA